MSSLKALKNVMAQFRKNLKAHNVKLYETDTDDWEAEQYISATFRVEAAQNCFSVRLFEDKMQIVLDLLVDEAVLLEKTTDYNNIEELNNSIVDFI